MQSQSEQAVYSLAIGFEMEVELLHDHLNHCRAWSKSWDQENNTRCSVRNVLEKVFAGDQQG